jgi:hypothetical protein
MVYYADMSWLPAKLRDRLPTLGRPQRELGLLLAGLVLGLLAMPLLLWVAGLLALGPYANGGFGALLGDFFAGLARGSLACWLVLAGPYLLVCLFRLLRVTLREISAHA